MKNALKTIKELKEILKNPSPNLRIRVYDVNKDERGKSVATSKKEKMTLAKLAITINNLAIEMRNGFKQVNTRLDNVEKRLDYIVTANNLKDLPESNK